jgi:hypothetical protein
MKPLRQTLTGTIIDRHLDYDPATGIFTRKNSRDALYRRAAGFVHHTGYMVIKLGNKPFLAHRLAWVWMHGEWPNEHYIDHINLNKLDNRICNLRKATHGQNVANSRPRSASGQKGAYPVPGVKNKWQAQINIDGKTTTVGFYDSLEEAALAYRAAATKLYGEFARFQ